MDTRVRKWLFDKQTKTKILNPEWEKLREEDYVKGIVLIDGEEVLESELLGIENPGLYNDLTVDELIGPDGKKGVNERSFTNLKFIIETLYFNLSKGIKPKFSMVYYLGKQANLNSFAYTILSSARNGHLTVAPLLTPSRLKHLSQQEDFEEKYLKPDLAVMLLPEGTSQWDIETTKGVMQQRAMYNKPTIVLLSSFSHKKHILLNLCMVNGTRGDLDNLSNARYDLGVLVGLTYGNPLTEKDLTSYYKRAILTTNTAYDLPKETGFNPNDENHTLYDYTEPEVYPQVEEKKGTSVRRKKKVQKDSTLTTNIGSNAEAALAIFDNK